ncbi:MAG: hypothetical protein ABJA70_12720 [Chryseolinea sp.]
MAQSEEAKRRYKKIMLSTAAGLLPIILLISILIYTKLYGFKRALQELVATQTNGEYTLAIGATEVHLRTLSFKFDKVLIDRNPWAVDNGVESVKIPFFELQFGSFASLFTEEFSIRNLTIEEPLIQLHAAMGRKNQPKKNALIPRQIMKLYPAIESILNRFNIESLRIVRASIQIDQNKDQPLRINFIDLLIEHWRMRDLSSQSQLKLSIEKQNLDFGRANMEFSGIEYNFLKHHLIFNNFHIASADSLTDSDIDVSGESLILRNLDYKEFSENLKYKLERAEINRPIIQARFKWKKPNQKKDVDKDMVTRILRQTLGECTVDSAVIREARVHIEMQKEKDTIKIDLPDVDFKMHGFAVLDNHSDFQVGEVEVNLHGSEITLSNSLRAKLDEVLFDSHHNLTLRKITIFSPGATQPIASLSSLQVNYFNLMNLLLYNHFNASSASAEGGVLNIGLFAPATKTSDKDTTYHLAGLLIHTVSLKNIEVNYADAKQRFALQGLDLSAKNVRYGTTGELEYIVKNIRAKKVTFKRPDQRLVTQFEEISFNGKTLKAAHINVLKDSITIDLKHVNAEMQRDQANDFKHWNNIDIDRADIAGRLPIVSRPTSNAGPTLQSTIEHLNIKSLGVSVSDHQGSIGLKGAMISLDGIALGQDVNMPEVVKGKLSEVTFRNKDIASRSSEITLNYPKQVNVHDLTLDANHHTFIISKISLNAIEHDDDTWEFGKIMTHRFTLMRRQQNFITSDSLHISGVKWKGSNDPYIDQLEIFKPIIKVSERTRNSSDPRPREQRRRYIPEHVIVHPGEIELTNGQKITFGTWVSDKAKGTLKGTSLHTSLNKMDVDARNITVLEHQIVMDSVSLISNKAWYGDSKIESSRIDGRFRNVSIKGFTLNSFLRTNRAKGLHVEMDRMALDVLRDKRLTDPPMSNKPSTLDGTLALPDNISLASFTIRDGRIDFHQISDKTGEEGYVMLDKLFAKAKFDSLSSFISLDAKTSLYNSGELTLAYQTLDASRFKLKLNIINVDLTKLNQIVMPLQAVKIKSGVLKEYTMNIDADDDKAVGKASITYDNLHLELFKHNEPERRNLGSEMLTLVADGIILKHKKEKATVEILHSRVKYKSVFQYWVTSAVDGAVSAVRRGRKIR